MSANPASRRAFRSYHSTQSWLMAVYAVLAISAPAAAEPKNQSDEAEALFTEARRLLTDGKPEQACPKFEQSQKVDPAAGTLINLARCYALLGRTASAWAAYRAAAAASRAGGQTKREHVARAEADALEPELATITIHPPEGTVPAGLEIQLDGATWLGGNAAAPLDPGAHAVVARAPGFLEWSEHFETVPREQREIQIPPLYELPAEVAPPRATSSAKPALRPFGLSGADLAAATPTPRPKRQARGSELPPSKLRALGIVVSGAGIVGFATGLGFGLRARQLNAQSHEGKQCDATGCNPHGLELNHAARDAAAVATVAIVSGAALSAAGVTLYLLGGASAPSSVSLGLSPVVTTRGTSLVLHGSL